MNTRFLMMLSVALLPAIAMAKPTVNMVELQSGFYVQPNCDLKDDDSSFDMCVTECKISYPNVQGIVDEANQRALNQKWLRKAQVNVCEGERISTYSDEKHPNVISSDYSVVFNDGVLLGLTENGYSYGAGAAHGNYATGGVIIDSRHGKELSTLDILDAKKLRALNIYLNKAIEKDDRSYDNLRNFKGKELPVYISDMKRDFALVLDEKKGLYALFGIYQVGPYSSGEIDYPIPAEFIIHPHIKAIVESLNAGR